MKEEIIRAMAANGSSEIPYLVFLGNLILSAFLAYLVGLFYVKYGCSASNRSDFSRNFVLLTMTTMVVISIVKSSLALSLGLVGALSIVRFRSAIKEPEELTFLFLCICIGLGMGAGQGLITISAIGLVLGVLWIRQVFGSKAELESTNIFLTISGNKADSLREILPELKKYFQQVDMKRWEDRPDGFSASFMVDCLNAEQLLNFKDAIRKDYADIQIAATDVKVL